MLRKRKLRRSVAVLLIVLGGVLIYLAPADFAGRVLLTAGIVLELAGIALERRQ